MLRHGATLLEFLVVIAVIGFVAALLLPAVQASRESARRAQCASNLRQIILGVHQHEAVHGELPPGGVPTSHGWLVFLLPHVEQQALYDQLDLTQDLWIGNSPHLFTRLAVYRCPSDGGDQGKGHAPANYAGSFGVWAAPPRSFNGLSQPDEHSSLGGGPMRWSDVTDGLSQTAAVSEVLVGNGTLKRRRAVFFTRTLLDSIDEFALACEQGAYRTHPATGAVQAMRWRGRPWMEGGMGRTWYNHVLAPNRPSCFNNGVVPNGGYTAASNHPGGVKLAYADGHLQFIDDSIDMAVWRAMGARSDGH